MKAEKPFEGYTLYKVFHNKEGRWYAQLVSSTHRTTVSYARYLMSVKLGRLLDPNTETVDHINENKTDDRIENLQLLPRLENTRRSAKGRTMTTLICPVCEKEFIREIRQTHFCKGGRQTTCSRKCGGIRSHWA